MSLSKDKLKGDIKTRVFNSLKANFTEVSGTKGYDPIVLGWWDKLAEAVSDIAIDIVDNIQSDAEVQPGIMTANMDVTSSPGKIQ